MKKISKISVSSKGFLTSRYFKALIVILLILMLVMSAVLIKIYIDINKKNTEKSTLAKNVITQMDKNINEYKIFENENGMLGVSDRSEQVVIEPLWEDIYILSEKRFIVGKTFDKDKKMGIIDSESNILVPFIFKSFKSFSNEFIGGFTNDNDFFLFDKNGTLLSDKIWTDYKYSDGIMYLNDSDDEYRCKFIDGDFKFVYVNIKRNPANIPFNITLTESEITDTGIDEIKRIADITDGYLQYLISGNNINGISDLTAEQYYSSLSSNDFFKECHINNMSDFSIEISEEKSVTAYNVKFNVNYDYRKKDIDLKNISSEITFIIVRDEDNRLVLKNINKTEL